MPVSSPTEFLPASGSPPTRIIGSTGGAGATGVRLFIAGYQAAQFTQPINDLVVIGASALSAGTQAAPITDTNLAGMVVLGSGAAAALTSTSGASLGTRGPSTIVGFNALPNAANSNQSTIVGANILSGYAPAANLFGGNVYMGESAGLNFGSGGQNLQNVVIGFRAVTGPSPTVNFTDSVVIGANALNNLNNTAGGPGPSRCVLIGQLVGSSMGSTGTATVCSLNDNVVIGFAAGDGGPQSISNVYIGTQVAGSTNAGTPPQNNVAIGSNNNAPGAAAGNVGNVVIGSLAANNVANQQCVLLGFACGSNAGATIAAGNNQFLLEVGQAANRSALLYGQMANAAAPGGLIVGHSTPGTNRDLPGFNILKLLNGSTTGVAPVGGGFFYSSAGRLHWVDTANNDWALTGTAAGQLGSSVVGYTNNAGAAAGTLTNAPVAGNPTKWAPVNDNGTIRNVPMW